MTHGSQDAEAGLAPDAAGWTPVCTVDDLGASPRAVWVQSSQIVVWRTSGGTLVAMDDSCPHQGNALSGGAVVGDRIRCPAHGWEVAADGWCDRAGAGVRSHPIKETHGTIFINMNPRR